LIARGHNKANRNHPAAFCSSKGESAAQRSVFVRLICQNAPDFESSGRKLQTPRFAIEDRDAIKTIICFRMATEAQIAISSAFIQQV